MRRPTPLPAVALLGLFLTLLSSASVAAQSPRPEPEGLDAVIEFLELREAPLRDALRLIADEAGINLVASEEAAEKSVDIFVQNLTVRQTIESLAKSYGMWYRVDDDSGVVRVMTARELQRDIVLFRDEKTAVFTMLFPNALDVALAIRNLFGDRVELSLDRDALDDEYFEMNQRFQRFDLLDRRGQSLGILDGGSTYVQGGGNLQGGLSNLGRDEGRNRLRRDANGRDEYAGRDRRLDEQRAPNLTPDQIAALQQLADQESGRPLIDPIVLDRLQGARTSIYVTLLRRSNTIAVRSSDAVALEEIEKLVHRLDTPVPQVLLEVKVLSVELGDDEQTAFDFSFDDGNSSAGVNGLDFLTGSGGAGGLIYRFVNDQFLARLQAVRSRKKMTTLASPTLLVSSSEVARLFVGEERPVVRNIATQTTVNQNVVTTTPSSTVETRPVGTTLLITPNVNADRTVTLRILQETSEIRRGAATIPVVTGNGNVIDQPVDVVGSRSVSGTVVAKDGLALALGGLVEEGVREDVSGVPILMDIPLLGLVFRHDEEITYRRELVVLVRPHVLFTAQEGEAISRQLADDLVHPSAPSLGGSLGVRDPEQEVKSGLPDEALRRHLKFLGGKAEPRR
ncbi:MAG: hypothetical protein R3F20_03710 [Planctomycetota bacterium]